MLESRLTELLGSMCRFHLHAVFDRPSRSVLRAAERGEAARELLANDAQRDSRGASLRFYVPRAVRNGAADAAEGEGAEGAAVGDESDAAAGSNGLGGGGLGVGGSSSGDDAFGPGTPRSLTAKLRKELATLELVELPLNGEMGPLGQRSYV